MKPEEVTEEHRKYLGTSDNPRVTTSAVFKLLSDSVSEIKERLVRIETKQENTIKHTEKSDARLDKVEGDLEAHCLDSAKATGGLDERFKWQEKSQKLILSLLVFVIALVLYLHFGIGFPLP